MAIALNTNTLRQGLWYPMVEFKCDISVSVITCCLKIAFAFNTDT